MLSAAESGDFMKKKEIFKSIEKAYPQAVCMAMIEVIFTPCFASLIGMEEALLTVPALLLIGICCIFFNTLMLALFDAHVHGEIE